MPTQSFTAAMRDAVIREVIPPGQLTLYKVLYEAGEKWVSSTELASTLRSEFYDLADQKGLNSSFRGVLGALARRIKGTPKLKPSERGLALFLERTTIQGQTHYRMTQELRDIIDATGKLKKAISLPIGAIYRKYNYWEPPGGLVV